MPEPPGFEFKFMPFRFRELAPLGLKLLLEGWFREANGSLEAGLAAWPVEDPKIGSSSQPPKFVGLDEVYGVPRLAKGSELCVGLGFPKMSLEPPPPIDENGSDDLAVPNGSAGLVLEKGSDLVLPNGSAGFDELLPKGSDDAAVAPPPPIPLRKSSMSPSLFFLVD